MIISDMLKRLIDPITVDSFDDEHWHSSTGRPYHVSGYNVEKESADGNLYLFNYMTEKWMLASCRSGSCDYRCKRLAEYDATRLRDQAEKTYREWSEQHVRA